jgi:hypothetical protein
MTTAMEVPQSATMPLSNTSKGKTSNKSKTVPAPTPEQLANAAAHKAKVEAESKAKESKLQSAFKKLTAEWSAGVGKTVEGTLHNAATIAEAKTELNSASMFSEATYERFVHKVCHISVRTADKYVMIDTAFGTKGAMNKYKDQLPPDWTKIYQLSRFVGTAAAGNLTKKAEKDFLKTLDYIVKPIEKDKPNSFATEIEINAFVNGLLGVEPRTKLDRPGKGEPAIETTKGKDEDGETTYAVPDAKTGSSISHAASASLGEAPTPEQIEAEIEGAQDALFADDGNEVLTESFFTAYDTLRLRNKIKALLHEENLTNIEVIVRQKVAV